MPRHPHTPSRRTRGMTSRLDLFERKQRHMYEVQAATQAALDRLSADVAKVIAEVKTLAKGIADAAGDTSAQTAIATQVIARCEELEAVLNPPDDTGAQTESGGATE